MVSKMVDGNAGLDLQECSDCGEELALPGLPQCARCDPDSYLPLVEDAATASEVLSHIYALDDPAKSDQKAVKARIRAVKRERASS